MLTDEKHTLLLRIQFQVLIGSRLINYQCPSTDKCAMGLPNHARLRAATPVLGSLAFGQVRSSDHAFTSIRHSNHRPNVFGFRLRFYLHLVLDNRIYRGTCDFWRLLGRRDHASWCWDRCEFDGENRRFGIDCFVAFGKSHLPSPIQGDNRGFLVLRLVRSENSYQSTGRRQNLGLVDMRHPCGLRG